MKQRFNLATSAAHIHLFTSLFFVFCVSQLGPNIKQLFRLVEDFVDVIGLRMKAFQDMYEVTDNLGEAGVRPQPSILFQLFGLRLNEKRQSWAGQGGADE